MNEGYRGMSYVVEEVCLRCQTTLETTTSTYITYVHTIHPQSWIVRYRELYEYRSVHVC